jgi:hypothetical protein
MKSTKIDSSDSSDYSSQHQCGLLVGASLWTTRPTITLDCTSYCPSHSSGILVPPSLWTTRPTITLDYSSQHHSGLLVPASGLLVPTSLWTTRPTITLDHSSQDYSGLLVPSSGLLVPSSQWTTRPTIPLIRKLQMLAVVCMLARYLRLLLATEAQIADTQIADAYYDQHSVSAISGETVTWRNCCLSKLLPTSYYLASCIYDMTEEHPSLLRAFLHSSLLRVKRIEQRKLYLAGPRNRIN